MYNKNKRVNTHTHTTSEQHMLVFGFTFNRSFTGTIPATINQHIDELLEKKKPSSNSLLLTSIFLEMEMWY